MWNFFFFFIVLVFIHERTEGKPKIKPYNYGLCTKGQYRCENEDCIERSNYCDGLQQCPDNSDERYCNIGYYGGCPAHYPFFRCHSRFSCIPLLWQCDGIFDCEDYSDELNCMNDIEKMPGAMNAESHLISWFKNQRRNALRQRKWGENILRAAIALYLHDENFFYPGNKTGEELSYEVDSYVLARLLRKHHDPLSASELALAIHSALVTCNNPRDFHGVDLVGELRDIVSGQANYTSPFVLLSLCNAEDRMSQTDVDKLISIAHQAQHPFWADTQALALMALSCIAEKSGSYVVPEVSISNLASKLRHLQLRDGKIVSLKTTALVIQALIASCEENDDEWNMEKAVNYLVRNQEHDGSFGSFLNSYYALPLFRYKTFLNISFAHCAHGTEVIKNDVILNNMKNKKGERIRVTYSLWLGDNVELVRLLQLKVASNISFFEIMQYAAAIDDRYKFEFSVLDLKPYIHTLSGVQNDPEKEKYWFLFKSKETKSLPELVNDSPSDVMVYNNEHFVMWYKTGHWNEKLWEKTGEFFEDFSDELPVM